LSEIYSVPNADFATKAVKTYLAENDISLGDLAGGNGTVAEEKPVEAPKVEETKEVAEEKPVETKPVEEKVSETPPPTKSSVDPESFDDMDRFLREGAE